MHGGGAGSSSASGWHGFRDLWFYQILLPHSYRTSAWALRWHVVSRQWLWGSRLALPPFDFFPLQIDLGPEAAAALEAQEAVAADDLDRLRSGLEDLFHLF